MVGCLVDWLASELVVTTEGRVLFETNVNITPESVCPFNVYLFIRENIIFVSDIFRNDIKVQKIKYIKFPYRGSQIVLHPQCD
jgi:hypothetical protein